MATKMVPGATEDTPTAFNAMSEILRPSDVCIPFWVFAYGRMRNYKVLHPTGWDAFGLPAENAAIERGLDPAVWTQDNIAKMKEQLKSMNTSFDWECELSTCSPSFYKHTQKIFLMLHRRGLAYQAEAMVNYDPVDKTVLANEQVDSHGRSWRSGALVQQLMLKQWFFKITAFQKSLLDDLSFLKNSQGWPERVLMQQSNWLGRSEGAKLQFQIQSRGLQLQPIKLFTTRPDTLFGVTYIALSLSHPTVQELAKDNTDLQRFLAQKSSFGPETKEGFLLPFVSALNPLSSLSEFCSKPLPVYVAPYVLEDYGEGAVMGVPGHDGRDLAFWKMHQPQAPVPIVVLSGAGEEHLEPVARDVKEAYVDRGTLTSLCGRFAGLQSLEAGTAIVNELQNRSLGEMTETWRLRDWLVSRQRYWGTPIPIIHCKSCGPVPVPEHQLPVELPQLDESVQGTTGNPLEKIQSWVNTTCPKCRGSAKRETDTMDTFVDSSWYYLRFPDAHNEAEPFSLSSASTTLPVDTYVGGVEHAILHLLYARFIYKFLASEGLLQHAEVQEPFSQLVAQGMVHGRTFSDPHTGRFLLPNEVEGADSPNPRIVATGEIPAMTWEKMSKSKHNGVDPSTCIQRYGADATRAHILFAAPVSEILQWDEEKIVGIQRWFHRISRLVSQCPKETQFPSIRVRNPEDFSSLTRASAEAVLLTQNTIRSVTRTFERDIYGLNTAISDLIKLANGLISIELPKVDDWIAYQSLTTLIRMLAPIAPAFAEQCWEDLHANIKPSERITSVLEASWPEYILDTDLEAKLTEKVKTTLTCAVQINGKLRFTAQVPAERPFDPTGTSKDESKESLIQAILQTDEGKHWLFEKNDWEKRKRVVVVGGGKVVNIVF